MKDYFSLAFNNFKRRKLRSWLTMIGIFIGIATVVALISLGQGLQNAVKEQFEKIGLNKIIVTAGAGGAFGGVPSAEKLGFEDVGIIKRIKGVELTAEIVYSSAYIQFREEKKLSFIIGFPVDETSKIVQDLGGFKIDKGRNLKEGDKYKVVVGYLLGQERGFFKKAVNLRDKIIIKDKKFEVVGILEKVGNSQDDSQIYLPIDSVREIFNKSDEIDVIYVQVKSNFDINKVTGEIKKELRDYRNEEEGEESFSVQTFEQILETFGSILSIVQIVLVGIAAISLLVGGIGIMNTMYTAVLERTKEIGTMKAIGAKNSDVLFIFLFEAGLLGLVGGLIGIAFGIGLGKLAEYIGATFLGSNLLRADFPVPLLIGSLSFSILIGIISGIFPAMQAARLKPADALRYE